SPSARRQEAQYAENALQQLQEAQQIEDKLETYKEKLWSAPKGVNPEELENYQPPVQRQKNTPSTSNPSSSPTTTTADEETGAETESQEPPTQEQHLITETEELE